MMPFEPGDIVRVPFPHVEAPRLRPRPALVVSARPIGRDGIVVWAVMITSAARDRWPGDLAIPDHEAAGLPIPSTIRTAKIATLQAADAEAVGKVDAKTLAAALALVRGHLG